MNKVDVAKILSILEVAYPHSYKDMDETKKMAMSALWERKFKDIPADLVFFAVDALIDHLKFPPSIAEVEEQLKEIYWDNFMNIWAYNSNTLHLSEDEIARVQYIDRELCHMVDGGRKHSELVSKSTKKMIGDGK